MSHWPQARSPQIRKAGCQHRDDPPRLCRSRQALPTGHRSASRMASASKMTTTDGAQSHAAPAARRVPSSHRGGRKPWPTKWSKPCGSK
eukprot:2043230-Prymnesium_polylepis.2